MTHKPTRQNPQPQNQKTEVEADKLKIKTLRNIEIKVVALESLITEIGNKQKQKKHWAFFICSVLGTFTLLSAWYVQNIQVHEIEKQILEANEISNKLSSKQADIYRFKNELKEAEKLIPKDSFDITPTLQLVFAEGNLANAIIEIQRIFLKAVPIDSLIGIEKIPATLKLKEDNFFWFDSLDSKTKEFAETFQLPKMDNHYSNIWTQYGNSSFIFQDWARFQKNLSSAKEKLTKCFLILYIAGTILIITSLFKDWPWNLRK